MLILRNASIAIFSILTLLSVFVAVSPTSKTISTVATQTVQPTVPITPPKVTTLPKPTLLESLHFYQSVSNEGYMTSADLQEFKQAIATAKELYPNVPSTLIFSTASTESTLNPYAVHPNRSDHGICGINYGYNGDELKHAGIITKESDLDKITPNVLSCAHLYNNFLNKTNGRVKTAMCYYKGTNKDGRVDKLYALYQADVREVYKTQKSRKV